MPPISSAQRSAETRVDEFVRQALKKENRIVDEEHAKLIIQEKDVAEVARLFTEFLQYPNASHDYMEQWEVDYFTNGAMELLGTSPAATSDGLKISANQLATMISAMKFALTFYRGQLEEDVGPCPDCVRRILRELEQWPSANRPLLSAEHINKLGDYLYKIFGNSFVRKLLERPLIEAPYRLQWKINRPLSLRDVSPEPPPPKSPKKKAKAKPKKKGAPSPPEDPTREVGTQIRPPGFLPLRLAAPFPLLYQLYTGEEYDEEEAKKKKKGKKK